MNIKQKSLKVNAILNVIKQACSIIFPLITFPYASRILGKFYYGKINFGSSIIGYISLIAGLGITNYAIREGSRVRNDKQKLTKLANEIFSINIVSTIIAYVVLLVLIIFWRRLDGYGLLLLIQSLTVVFTTLGTDWINSIHEDYLYITIRYIICQGLAVVLMLTLVKSENDYLIYALSSVSSTVMANICNIIYIKKQYDIHLKFTVHMNSRRHLRPILIMFGTAIASVIYINSDVTILGVLKNEDEVGLYSVSSKIYNLVKQLLNAILIVTIPRVSHDIAIKSKEEVSAGLSEILNNLLILIFPASAGLFMLSKPIILLLSGKEYIQAYTSLEILCIAMIFACLSCFFITVVLVPFRMEDKALISTIVSALINIGLNFVLIPRWGQNAAAFTTLLAELSLVIMGMFFSRNEIHLHVLKSFIIGIISALAVFTICYCVKMLNINYLLTILLSIFGSGVLFLIILFIGYREKFYYMINAIRRKNKG